MSLKEEEMKEIFRSLVCIHFLKYVHTVYNKLQLFVSESDRAGRI